MTGIRIRPAQPEDHEAIVACVNAAYQGYVEDIGEKPAPMLDDYKALIRAEAVTVAIDGDEVAGLIVMWARPDHWYVDNVAVWPERQGTGIGSILLARAEHVARAAGFDRNPAVHERGNDREHHVLRTSGVCRDPPLVRSRLQPHQLHPRRQLDR